MTSPLPAGPGPDSSGEIAGFVRARFGDAVIEPLAGDASVRQYFRIRRGDGSTVILARYPDAAREQLDRALRAWRALEPEVRVPRIIEHEGRFILQEDVGDVSLNALAASDPDTARRAMEEAVGMLPAIHRAADRAAGINPAFDFAKFDAELTMTLEFYVDRLVGLKNAAARSRIASIFERLCNNLLEHPYVLCHRDFHSENLVIKNMNVFVIDYQDLRMGPDMYDPASLFRDRGTIAWVGRDRERDLLARYARSIGADAGFESRYWEALLQRSLKIAGTFARQSVERGRARYLAFLDPALDAVRECVTALPQYAELLEVFPMSRASRADQE